MLAGAQACKSRPGFLFAITFFIVCLRACRCSNVWVRGMRGALGPCFPFVFAFAIVLCACRCPSVQVKARFPACNHHFRCMLACLQVLKRVGQECEAHQVVYWTAAKDGDLHQVRFLCMYIKMVNGEW